MTIQWPSDITIECDMCPRDLEVEIIEYLHGTIGIDTEDLRTEGWTFEGEFGEALCPQCAEVVAHIGEEGSID
jgi:hypothetical protein